MTAAAALKAPFPGDCRPLVRRGIPIPGYHAAYDGPGSDCESSPNGSASANPPCHASPTASGGLDEPGGPGKGAAQSPLPLKPYPGGKSRVADMVWARLGNCQNYIEPFMGSLAVLLRRPAEHFRGGYRVETCNDLNHYLVNFWRAVAADPEKVAEYADWPVSEADLHARHKWLVRSAEAAEWRKRMAADPHHFDAKIAGWWVWGACCWIGRGWCAGDTVGSRRDVVNRDGMGYGLIRGPEGSTDWAQVPNLTEPTGVTPRDSGGRPQLADAYGIGRGVNGGAAALSAQVPLLRANGNIGEGVTRGFALPVEGTCDARRAWLVDWMRRLADRLRLVRTCYGHWARVCDSDSTLTRLGTTGVFLDPPYPANRGDTGKKSRDANLYATDKGSDLNALRDEVLAWCRKWGQNPQIRVAVCGYEGDGYEALEREGWAVEAWEASGGYGNQGTGKKKAANAKRERIWFSPSTLTPGRGRSLFDGLEPSHDEPPH